MFIVFAANSVFTQLKVMEETSISPLSDKKTPPNSFRHITQDHVCLLFMQIQLRHEYKSTLNLKQNLISSNESWLYILKSYT